MRLPLPLPLLLLLAACRPSLDPCVCPAENPGHAVVYEGSCACLPFVQPQFNEPGGAEVFDLAEGDELDWAAVNDALADNHVVVRFTPGGRYPRFTVRRTDDGPYRLHLDGGGEEAGRAVVAGILTPYDSDPTHRVTVRGFEVTGSRDKGIYWESGDDVVIEDVEVHDNRGSPAVHLQYSSRSGYPSTNFTVRNSHIYDQHGECLYIGGSEGEDADSHVRLRIENNLVHDCRTPWSTQDDAINVKDRLVDVVVRRNVVLRSDWGIEVASSGLYSENLVLDTRREGFQVSDYFSPIGSMTFLDNAVIRPGHDGFHLETSRAEAPDIRFARNSVFSAGEAGLLLATDAGAEVEIEDFAVVDSPAAFDGWGEAQITLWSCATEGNDADFARLFEGLGPCNPTTAPDLSQPAGDDGLFFTEDDPWRIAGGATLGR